jgi:hypothetical protein
MKRISLIRFCDLLGSFCAAFQEISDAVLWAVTLQERLMQVEWDEKLLAHPAAAEEWGGKDDETIFKGLRVRIGMAHGTPRTIRDPMTRRIEYIGPTVRTPLYYSCDIKQLNYYHSHRWH